MEVIWHGGIQGAEGFTKGELLGNYEYVGREPNPTVINVEDAQALRALLEVDQTLRYLGRFGGRRFLFGEQKYGSKWTGSRKRYAPGR